jgi:hypothetical protein
MFEVSLCAPQGGFWNQIATASVFCWNAEQLKSLSNARDNNTMEESMEFWQSYHSKTFSKTQKKAPFIH